MARPFQRPTKNPVTQYYCDSCEEWYDRGDFTQGTFYSTDGSYVEVGGEYYYDDYTSWEIWTHDECGEPVSDVDRQPQTRTLSSVWVCGECKSAYEDYDTANECCE